jgi:hypothetical protein
VPWLIDAPRWRDASGSDIPSATRGRICRREEHDFDRPKFLPVGTIEARRETYEEVRNVRESWTI